MATSKKQDDKRQYLDANLTKVKALDNGVFEGIVATSAVDRHGEILEISGLDTSAYMSTNPIVLFGHDYWDAESVIGKALDLTKTKGGQLLSKFELFIDDNPKAALVAKLIKKGVLALSIGFVPTDIEGNAFTKSEMVEYSVVPVPANAQAAITARSLDLTKKELAILSKEISKVKGKDMAKTKGAVADEIAAEEAWEQKWANMQNFWDVIYAFCDVYYDQNTSVDDFSMLLNETVGLLKEVADGSYVAPDPEDAPAEGEDDDDEVLEYSVSNALKKGVDHEKVKALIAKGKDLAEDTEEKNGDVEKVDDPAEDVETPEVPVKTESKAITKAMDDGDVSFLTKLADDMQTVSESMSQMAKGVTDKLQKDAGGDEDGQQSGVDQANGDNGGKPMSATNTVVADGLTDTEPKEIEVDGKKLDISDMKADTLKQLASKLKQAAVELEEDASKIASSTTDGVSSPTVRKRKLILRKAKNNVITVDKMVELTLRELSNKN